MFGKILLVCAGAVASLLLFWLPFISKTNSLWGVDFGGKGMEVVVQNFDGINFLVAAKTLYDPAKIVSINEHFLTGNEPLYFTAHYPGFPLLIRFFDLFVSGTNALLLAILLSNILLAVALYLFFSSFFGSKKLAVLLSLIALFLPPRMLSDRGVGSNEPLFISMVLLSLYMAHKGKHWLAGALGGVAVMTRSPGILLFGGYLLALFSKRESLVMSAKRLVPYLLIPLALLGVWVFYGFSYQDPLAYFKAGVSMNIHFPPFLAFGNNQTWVTDMWRDDIFYVYLVFGAGLTFFQKNWLAKKSFSRMSTFYFGVIYLVALFFVAHRDIARYSLPIAPIVIAGYGKYLTDKRLAWLLILLLIPVYLLGWQFVLSNIQPVSDWSALL